MLEKLLLEKYEILEMQTKLNGEIYSIKHFLKEYKETFDRKESIESLKKIESYLITIKEKDKTLEEKLFKNAKKLNEVCKHSFVIKNCYERCAICGSTNYDLKNGYFIDCDSTVDLKNIIINLINEGKNIEENLNDYIFNNEKINVYRR